MQFYLHQLSYEIMNPYQSKIIKEDSTTAKNHSNRSNSNSSLIKITSRAATTTLTSHQVRLTTSRTTITTTTTTQIGEHGRLGRNAPNRVEQDGLHENESVLITSQAKSKHFFIFRVTIFLKELHRQKRRSQEM